MKGTAKTGCQEKSGFVRYHGVNAHDELAPELIPAARCQRITSSLAAHSRNVGAD